MRQHQPLAPVAALLASAIEAGESDLHSLLETGGQQGVLVWEVVIERGLGDPELGGDFGQRGSMIALEIEERRRFAQHFLALDAVHVFLAREQSQPPDNDLFLLPGQAKR